MRSAEPTLRALRSTGFAVLSAAAILIGLGVHAPAALADPQPAERAPLAQSQPTAPTANLDPADDLLVGPPEPISDCEARLKAAGVSFRPAKLRVFQKRGVTCGAEQVIEYRVGPQGIRWQPPPVLTCQMALGLVNFEPLLQRLAEEHLGVRVKSVRQGGTYNCRSMARFNLVSEHSYANAMDIYGFTLANGRRIDVLASFGKPEIEPKTSAGAFLRALARAAFDEAVFSVVITRFFDELHRDHIHVDMARYRTDGTR